MKILLIIGLLFLVACTQSAAPVENATNTTLQRDFSNLEACKIVQRGNTSLNIIIGVHNVWETTPERYINKSIEALYSVTPFNESRHNIYTFNIEEKYCWAKNDKKIVRSQLDCDWDAINYQLKSCGLQNFKFTVITGERVQAVTVPTYYKSSISIISEEEFDRYVFLHELGHQFGLQEEYVTLRVLRTSPAYDERKPNCAADIATAKRWWGDMVGKEDTGYYEGCAGHEEYIRPNKDTLMGTAALEGNYGYVNTQYLREAINCCYAGNRSAYSCDAFFAEFPEWLACRG